jgi:TPR repeat protein/formylglycine-generating enzyme required for sulfatase activity
MLLLLPALTQAQQAPPCRQPRPLSEDQLTTLLKNPAPRTIQLVASCGIDFEPDEGVVRRLRSAGASQTVLDAVRAATGPAERNRQAELALWNSIKNSGNMGAFEDFLSRYPDGQFAAEARQKYQDLRVAGVREEMERTLAAGQWDAADGKIRDLLRVVLETEEIRGWQRRVADGREAERKQKEAAAALKAEQASWESIKDSRDPQLFEQFLREHPSSQYAGAAREKITALKPAAPSPKRVAPVIAPSTIAAGTKEVNPKDGLTYVWIPPGRFLMGCSPADSECSGAEKPAHEVTITEGFWLGQTPVTQQAYQRVTGQSPSHFKGANLPVEFVNWFEAQSYCSAIGGRLPTEAEWEYSARAGSTGARYGNLDEIAWYSGNSGNKTHEVGQKQANAWGLYDMLGNVWQWTADWFGDYQSGEQNDPSGAESGQFRMLRGGSWSSLARLRLVRVSYRCGVPPSSRGGDMGLRCVEGSPPPVPVAPESTVPDRPSASILAAPVPVPTAPAAPPATKVNPGRDASPAPRKLPASAQDLNQIAKRADAAFGRKNYGTAAPLYQQLADRGRDGAMNRLGYMYENGLGLAQSDPQAVAWFRKAAEKNNPEGMYNLGTMYANGRGVAKDDAQAVAWFRKAAEKNSPEGMYSLGTMYDAGRGVAKDDAQALAWYRKAAEKGHPQGMNDLGAMYDAGQGVAQDYAQAVAWYRKAAEKGESAGMNNLGAMYANGRGVAKDDKQAVAWFRKAADKGDPRGTCNLGIMYANGRGVREDDKQAVAWYRKAAEKGEPQGMNNLGLMYEHGQGVAQDNTQAVTWYRKAAALGNEDAIAHLKWLETPRATKKAKTTTARKSTEKVVEKNAAN